MNDTLKSFVGKILSLAGVIVFCFIATKYSSISVINECFPGMHLSSYFRMFEQHFWQFSFSFIAIIILSRGHLWSYGISSKNLKTSMVFLSWLYVATIVVTLAMMAMAKEMVPSLPETLHSNPKNITIVVLTYWMSAPVANIILFFGFGQTVLVKQWGDSVALLGMPLVVIVAALLFTIFSTGMLMTGALTPIILFGFGIFVGYVYWKTGSLITPMLAHAFFFGFPLVVKIVSTL